MNSLKWQRQEKFHYVPAHFSRDVWMNNIWLSAYSFLHPSLHRRKLLSLEWIHKKLLKILFCNVCNRTFFKSTFESQKNRVSRIFFIDPLPVSLSLYLNIFMSVFPIKNIIRIHDIPVKFYDYTLFRSKKIRILLRDLIIVFRMYLYFAVRWFSYAKCAYCISTGCTFT